MLAWGSAGEGTGEPALDLMLGGRRDAGGTPAQSLRIGDTSLGIMMAKAAGARTIGVGWG